MDDLPHSVLLHILNRLDDSADVARCRVASKNFNTVFPDVRSINLLDWVRRYMDSCSKVPNSSSSQYTKPFKSVFLDLISKLKIVESVSISLELLMQNHLGPFLEKDFDLVIINNLGQSIEGDFFKEWLPRVSELLKSLSIDGHPSYHSQCQSDFFPLISTYCHNLVDLNLKYACLSMQDTNQMSMLTSLTLEYIHFEDEHLHGMDNCFPNLQYFKMVFITGLDDPIIHHPNLKTIHWVSYLQNEYFNLITPNLTTLIVECPAPVTLHVEAPMLSNLHLFLMGNIYSGGVHMTAGNIENLKTLWLETSCILTLLSEFGIIKSVENLTLESKNKTPRGATYPTFNLTIMFAVFRNVSSLCIKSNAWSELETCKHPELLKRLNRGTRLKTIRAYLMLVDPLLTFSYVARLLDQCVSLSNISFLIRDDVVGTVSEDFMSKCVSRWPELNWRWGIWGEDREDSWITDGSSIQHDKPSKRRHLSGGKIDHNVVDVDARA